VTCPWATSRSAATHGERAIEVSSDQNTWPGRAVISRSSRIASSGRRASGTVRSRMGAVGHRLFATALLAIVPATARSQTVEITPVVGYRFGGNFAAASSTGYEGTITGYEVEAAASFGVHLGYRVSRDGEIEVLYSRQDTRVGTSVLFEGVPVFDLALETWQAGGNYLFEEEKARVRPYIGMGLGFTRLLPGPAGMSSDTRFSASFAAGAKVWLGRHVGLRFEGRGLFTFLGGSDRTFCRTGQGCQVDAAGSGISQGDFRAGVVLRF
jgi:hypothetical protein